MRTAGQGDVEGESLQGKWTSFIGAECSSGKDSDSGLGGGMSTSLLEVGLITVGGGI